MVREAPCTHTILVVDDDALVREALRRQLRRAGYAMEAAGGGAEALEFAGHSVADLVILDLKMPGMDGFETCRRLKALEGWGLVPVLFLTGNDDTEDYQTALEAGADDFLTKPVRFQELLLRLHALLSLKASQGDLRKSIATIQAQQEVILHEKAMREKLEAFLLHDLKNPISNILLQARLQIEVLEAVSEESIPWGRVFGEAEQLMKLVTGWMDFTRSEGEGLRPRRTNTDLRQLLDQLLQRHALWLQVKQLRGVVEISPDLPEAHLDAVMMERVLGNLLENCIRYSPEGGEIRITARAGEENRVRLEVSDRGSGIPLHLRESIFDMYVQLEAASGQVLARESRGLGLAFCRLAAEAHDGRIWVEDHPAGGTRFVIEIAARGAGDR